MTPNPEVDYGHHWQLPTGQRARLSWNVTTGVLYLAHPERSKGDSALVVTTRREDVTDLLCGIWDDPRAIAGDLAWLAERLRLVDTELPDWALPPSRRH